MTDDGGQIRAARLACLPSSVVRPLSSDRANIEAMQRAKVVAEARSWIGTPYHNCADIKGVGVDCGMLLVRVFVDAGLVAPFDPRPYPFDWHLHRSDEKYLGFVFDRCAEVKEPKPGDVMVFRVGRTYSHGGVVTMAKPLTIVHAYFRTRCVIEEELSHNAEMIEPVRKPRFFSHWAAQSDGRGGGGERDAMRRERLGWWAAGASD